MGEVFKTASLFEPKLSGYTKRIAYPGELAAFSMEWNKIWPGNAARYAAEEWRKDSAYDSGEVVYFVSGSDEDGWKIFSRVKGGSIPEPIAMRPEEMHWLAFRILRETAERYGWKRLSIKANKWITMTPKGKL